MIREDILRQFSDLFGSKKVNGRDVNVEETIATLTRELRPAIAEALNARRTLLEAAEPVRRKYAWPKWEETFEDPVTGRSWTFRQVVQGLIDNFLDRESEWRWRLNDEVDVPADVHPLKNPGLELTGPWHPLDMAFNALNSAAPMNMPDFEDASPSHFQPQGTPKTEPVGTFAALQNAKDIFQGRWTGKPYEVVKKDKKRAYQINRPPQQWPTRLVRPPSIHVLYDHVTVDGQPAPGLISVVVLWVLNNYEALKAAGTGVYFYIPKMQTPREALIVEKLLARMEGILGVPAGTFKIKILYEEGNGGRYLPAIAWVFRRRLLGTNVGRWDYLGSLIEMWKDDPNGVFPDPQTVGMAAPNMIAYQRWNALTMLMAGMKHGDLTQGGPIGGMAAVMMYQPGDAYGRARYNPVAMRAVVVDKLRERLLGLMFVPDEPISAGRQVTLDDVLAGRVKGTAVRRVSAKLGCQSRACVRGCGKWAAVRASGGIAGGAGCATRDRGCERQSCAHRCERSGGLGAGPAGIPRLAERAGQDHTEHSSARTRWTRRRSSLAQSCGTPSTVCRRAMSPSSTSNTRSTWPRTTASRYSTATSPRPSTITNSSSAS